MGKMEFNYAEDEITPFVKPLAEPKFRFVAEPKFRFVTTNNEAPKDSSFQKAICYSSYYVMTFTAFCAFAPGPGQVANAAEVVVSILPL